MRRSPWWLAVVVVHSTFAGTTPEGTAWLEENAKNEGVVVQESGLQYKVLRTGSGDRHPTVSSPCECHYEGTLIDGTKFDSSYDRGSPATFAPNQVIKGWTEALQMMVEGDKWELYIPSELGYGDRGSPPKIPGGSVLKFTIEIIKIKGDTKPAARCDPATLDKCSDKETAYVKKMQNKGFPAIEAELKRLKGMSTTKGTKPELLAWLSTRKALLTKMAANPEL
ncbi:hypothetical protein CTAYLR_000313 [Chrysophaeum taylorii]|uniref:peptidylprolyl isomerase n=1 Tax=Chrysophaeum taylorii TaxID=2483200 RepID=A0AAD7UEQ0_9STRA|nr:hypothetical protein CTAYLR_000313 [Chrysophaeum taylorii]